MNVIQAVAGGQATGPGAPSGVSDNPLIALGTQILSGLIPQTNPATEETTFTTEGTHANRGAEDLNSIDLCPLIRDMLSGYSFLITGDLNVSVQLENDPSHRDLMYFTYCKSSGSVVKLASPPVNSIQARIKCSNMAVLVDAIKERDSSRVTIEYC